MADDESALSASDDPSIMLGTWNAMIRRSALTDEQKLFCLLMSSYADARGEEIYCGVATLAVDSARSYATARRYLEWMRDVVGIIEIVRRGNRRKRECDVYRLVVSGRLADHVHVMDPDEYDAAKDKVAAQNRRGSAERSAKAKHRAPESRDLRSQGGAQITGAQPVDNPPSALTQDERRTSDLRSLESPVPATSSTPSLIGGLRRPPNPPRRPSASPPAFEEKIEISEAPHEPQPAVDYHRPRERVRVRVDASDSPRRVVGFCAQCYGLGQVTDAMTEDGDICAWHFRKSRWTSLNGPTSEQPVVSAP